MTDIKKEDIIEWLSSQPVLVLSEIVKELEDKWGVEAAAPAAVMPAAAPAASGGAAAAEEKTSFDVVLKGVGSNKIAVVKVAREITGLGLKEAKDLVDSAPKAVKEGCSKDEAAEIEKKLKDAGAEVELK